MSVLKQTILAAALVAAALSISADIIWSEEQNVHLSWAAPGDTFPVPGNLKMDLNDDGIDDFQIGNFIDDLHPSWFYAKCYGNNKNTGAWIGNAGSVIDSSWSDWTGGEFLLVSWMLLLEEPGQAGIGPWAGMTGYMGLQFDADDGTHFGWVHMTAYDEFPGMTIHSWAYESTPGVGIIAGAVPEPSSAILTVIGGLAAWNLRRCRKRMKGD